MLAVVIAAAAVIVAHTETIGGQSPPPRWRVNAIGSDDYTARVAPDWMAVSKAGATAGELSPPPFRDAQGRVLLTTSVLFINDGTGGREFVRPAAFYLGESMESTFSRVCTSLGDLMPMQYCLNVVPTVLMEQVDSKVQMVEAATQALKPEHFSHAQWGGVLDAAYGFLRKTIRKDADAAADSLLLLALNKRVSRLEDAVVASSGVALASEGATTNTCSTTNNDSCAGSTHTHDRFPDVHRPDRCATIYDSFQPAALNPIQGLNGTKLLRTLAHRNELPILLNDMNLLGEGVEVGVDRGGYSAHILLHWTGRMLHLVDPWMAAGAYPAFREDHLEATLAHVAPYPGRFTVHRGFSTAVATEFTDSSLDFVYLDAQHNYMDVTNDLLVWWPKLKHGGLYCGDDFFSGYVSDGRSNFGVRDAVDEFASARGLRVYSTTGDLCGGRCPNWYLVKC